MLEVVLLIQLSVRRLAIILVTTVTGLKHYSRIVAPIFPKVDGKVFGQESDCIFVDFFKVLLSKEDLRELFHFWSGIKKNLFLIDWQFSFGFIGTKTFG